MKLKHLLFISFIIALASCSTAYKSGQTPDDLYASKGKVIVQSEDRYERIDNSYEERQIRMAIYDYRWRTLDDRYDYNYSYNPYSYGYNYGYYYNPYYYQYPVYAGGIKYINPKNTTIRTTNLNTYNNTITTYTPSKAGSSVRITSVRGYNSNNSETQTSTRTYDTRVYTPASSNNNNNSSSNSNSNSNSNSSSTGTPVSRPVRN